MKRRIITGDIHGCFNTLKTLLEQGVKITKEDSLYFVGDYIDRGPRSREVLDYLIDLKWRGFAVFPIRGNHEDMMLKAMEDPAYLQAWFNNGAEYTLRSFDIPEECIFDYECFRHILPRYIKFLETMPYYIEEEDFILCHAGLNFEALNPLRDIDSMLWIRDFYYDGSKVAGKRIIHGHTPVPLEELNVSLPDKKRKVVNLDAGCVYKGLKGYGHLLAYDADSGEFFYQGNLDIV